jgi:hypothetical protein
LSGNNIGGYFGGRGVVRTPEGPKEIAEAVRVMASLTSIDLQHNNLGPEGAKALAPALRDSTSLTWVNLLRNEFDTEAASVLLKVKAEKPMLRTFCGFMHTETALNYWNQGLGPADAMLLAPEISVMASVTECNLRGHHLNEQSAKELAKIGTEKRITLFGIKHGEREADFRRQGIGSVDAILIANDLAVTASVTSVRAFGNSWSS